MPPRLEERPLPGLLRALSRLRLWRPATLVSEAGERLGVGDAAGARRALEEAIARAPAWAEPLFLLSRCARLERKGSDEPGSRDEEEGLLYEALARDGEHAAAERALLEIRAWRFEPLTRAWHLFHGGRPAEALDAFRAALACTGGRLPEESRADTLAGIGWSLHGLRHGEQARAAFEQAIDLSPELAHAHKGLGISLYFLRRLEEAEVALCRALELEPRLADARAFLGWCAYDSKDHARARNEFEAAREANPLLADARWGLAWSLWRLDEAAAAATAFEEAATLNPTHPSAADVASCVLPDARCASLASIWAELIGTPNAARPRQNSQRLAQRPLVEALALLTEDRPADSLAVLEHARPVRAVDRWRARLLEGRARLALEEHDEALAAFLAATEIAPTRAESALAAARLLDENGEREKARDLLERARRGERNHPELATACELAGLPAEVRG
ncbi:MAG: hypothetical protein CMJ84_00570 [Planctomycetes bacterium]|jgi:tetratricopeptide (TPR) repeat protein|nr:hypothetical protein [Planctomycetota bacterium]MDP6409860.1 tetratricopeptide repeat protein [Planctomycetota bacterium]